MYFENLYRGKNPKMAFENRLGGSRRGCICNVEVEDTTVKYHIKTNHRAGAQESSKFYS